ncbi:MerR family transcriptional regulator [Paenibacillus sp. FSL F4-0125]|uniref:MerR family transcriptional regulator n=1 Tax=Paenibacillus sp. FSL F4-0125 TaxID=2954730 RepID=UPI0030F82FB2
MRIGEFIALTGTTKDTIRHYEDLELILSMGPDGKRIYTEKHLADYYAIQELKGYGVKLRDIQSIFKLKRSYGCGHAELIKEVGDSLNLQLEGLRKEEIELRNRIRMLEELVQQINEI